jgi:xanthine dehydrogenase molybdopterin-binding subunit B
MMPLASFMTAARSFWFQKTCNQLSLQRHLQNMLFYHKGLRVRKKPLPFVACARKAAILRVQIWSAHESDVVGLYHTRLGFPYDDFNLYPYGVLAYPL